MADFIYHPFFIQALGGVAFIFGVWAFSCKEDARLKKIMTAQCAALSVHYFLLQANGGAIAVFITGLRSYASVYKKLKHLGIIFIIFYIVFGFYRHEQWFDALPIIGSIVSTFGFFYFEKIPMRLCVLFSTALYIVHDAVVMSIAPFFMEIFIFAVSIRTIYAISKNENG